MTIAFYREPNRFQVVIVIDEITADGDLVAQNVDAITGDEFDTLEDAQAHSWLLSRLGFAQAKRVIEVLAEDDERHNPTN